MNTQNIVNDIKMQIFNECCVDAIVSGDFDTNEVHFYGVHDNNLTHLKIKLTCPNLNYKLLAIKNYINGTTSLEEFLWYCSVNK